MPQTVFRPYGKDGSDSVRCTNEKCLTINPPKPNVAGIVGIRCLQRKSDLLYDPKPASNLPTRVGLNTVDIDVPALRHLVDNDERDAEALKRTSEGGRVRTKRSVSDVNLSKQKGPSVVGASIIFFSYGRLRSLARYWT